MAIEDDQKSGKDVQTTTGRAPGGAEPSDAAKDDKPVLPGPKGMIECTHGDRNYLEDRGDHIHAGEDFPFPCGTPIVATEDGRVERQSGGGYGNYIDLHTTGGITVRYAHLSSMSATGNVKKGQVIGKSGGSGGYPCHLHFETRTDGGGYGAPGGTADPCKYLAGAVEGSGGGAGGDQGVNDTAAVEAIAKAAAFSTFLQMPGLFEQKEAMSLTGHKSLMNDQPLLPFIQQLCQASLRHFQSMPNGDFFAFFPDYFGGLDHRTPYWEIKDIEILDGKIDLSDDALATHVYVVGDIAGGMMDGTVDRMDKMQTAGVVTIFNAFNGDFITGEEGTGEKKGTSTSSKTTPAKDKGKEKTSQEDKDKREENPEALAFLQKYGARPHFEEAPMVRNPFFELFLAFQRFMLMWSQQFATTFEFTFMPELFPGGIVAFPDHGIQCYLEEVEHHCSYEDGFTTRATLTAPAALADGSGASVNPSADKIHEGMVRNFTLDPDLVAKPGQLPEKTKEDPKPRAAK